MIEFTRVISESDRAGMGNPVGKEVRASGEVVEDGVGWMRRQLAERQRQLGNGDWAAAADNMHL